ncbi:MAG: c-type cytochrome, partial [Verrucomicrobiae bacterium]|nr:c-type cytochrome [Verrucomicrobiae bacterium]
IRKDTQEKIQADYAALTEKTLTEWLGHADRRVRQKAQFELAKRGAFETLAAISEDPAAPSLARIHALWGLGQLTRYREEANWKPLLARLSDANSEIRAQAAKMLGDGFAASVAMSPAEFPNQQGQVGDRTLLSRQLAPLLNDANDRVKFHAALAIGNLGIPDSTKPLIAMLETVKPGQTYLRHAAIAGLTGCAETAELVSLAKHDSEWVRAAAVVALRRREDPAVAEFLKDRSAFVAAEAARAIHDDWTIPAAMPALAEALETAKHHGNESFLRRAINANFILGEPTHAARVVAFAADPKGSEAMRLEAFDALDEWTEPPVLDRVVGWNRPLAKREAAVIAPAVEAHVNELLTDASPEIQRLTMELANRLDVRIAPATLEAVFRNDESAESLRAQALRSLAAEGAPNLDELVALALRDKKTEVRQTSLAVLAKTHPDQAKAELKAILGSKSEPVALRQQAISLLPTVKGGDLLASLLKNWKTVPNELRLDLSEAAANPAFADDASVAAAWASIQEQLNQESATNLMAAFTMCLDGGDAKAGARVIQTNVASQCVACHKFADGKGSTVGPNLKSVGLKKDRAYLLESLVNPQAVITSGYGMITLTLNNGESVSGQFRGEKDGVVELRDPEGNSTTIKATDIKERSPVISTMPPMGLVLSKREVRDIVAYLATLRAEK